MNSKTYKAPKRRNVQHLLVKMKTGGGVFKDLKKEANKKESRKFDSRKENW